MASFPEFGEAQDSHVELIHQAVDDCLALYRSSAEAWVQSLPPGGATRTGEATASLMEDSARGLLIKIFLTILQADRHFSVQERQLAQVLLTQLWGRTFRADEIGEVVQELIPMADKYDWYALVRRFAEVPALRDRASQIETIVMRFGNVVAKADGTVAPEETHQLKGLMAEINRHLHPVPIENELGGPPPVPRADGIRSAAVTMPTADSTTSATTVSGTAGKTATAAARPQTDELRLQAALQSLDELIGLEAIKTEVREHGS